MAEMLYTSLCRFKSVVYGLAGTIVAAVLSVWLTFNKASWQIPLFDIGRVNMWVVLFPGPLVFLLLKLICSFFLPFVVSDIIPLMKKRIRVFVNYISYINENKLQKKTLLGLLLLYILLLLKLYLEKEKVI